MDFLDEILSNKIQYEYCGVIKQFGINDGIVKPLTMEQIYSYTFKDLADYLLRKDKFSDPKDEQLREQLSNLVHKRNGFNTGSNTLFRVFNRDGSAVPVLPTEKISDNPSYINSKVLNKNGITRNYKYITVIVGDENIIGF